MRLGLGLGFNFRAQRTLDRAADEAEAVHARALAVRHKQRALALLQHLRTTWASQDTACACP